MDHRSRYANLDGVDHVMKMPALKKTILFSIFFHVAGAAILYALVLPSRSLLTPGELKSSVEVIAGSPQSTSPKAPLKPATTHASTSADLGSSPTATASAQRLPLVLLLA